MKEQNTGEYDALVDEVERLRADNDEIDEVCTKRQLKIYELEAEIAKLRAKREELISALDGVIDYAEEWHAHYCEMWGARRKEQQYAILGAVLKARAALAEKGE